MLSWDLFLGEPGFTVENLSTTSQVFFHCDLGSPVYSPTLPCSLHIKGGFMGGPQGLTASVCSSFAQMISISEQRGVGEAWICGDGSRMRLCWKEDTGSWFCCKSMCFLQLTFTSKEANQYFGLNWATLGFVSELQRAEKGAWSPPRQTQSLSLFCRRNQMLKDEQYLCVSSSQITTLTLDTADVRNIILQLLKLPVGCLLPILWCLFGGRPQEGSFWVMGKQMFTFAK